MKPQATHRHGLACFIVTIWALLPFDQIPQMASGAIFASRLAHDKQRTLHSQAMLINEQLESNEISSALLIPKQVVNHYAGADNHNNDHYSTAAKSHQNSDSERPKEAGHGDQTPIRSKPIKSDRSLQLQSPRMIHETATGGHDNHLLEQRQLEQAKQEAPIESGKGQVDHVLKLFKRLEGQFVEQVLRQRIVDKDHLLMEKWLVDNINDLHRELKQTELDFEHYVQVTKNILAQNEQQLRRQLARASSVPLWQPIETTLGNDYATIQHHSMATANGQHLARQQHHHHLEKLLLAGQTK